MRVFGYLNFYWMFVNTTRIQKKCLNLINKIAVEINEVLCKDNDIEWTNMNIRVWRHKCEVDLTCSEKQEVETAETVW